MKAGGNDDLTDLLNEAKLTILELQREIESQKSEIEQLRQQNKAAQIDSPQNQSNLKAVHYQQKIDSGGRESKPAPTPQVTIPLEPVVIVDDNKYESPLNPNRKANDNLTPKFVSKNVREQKASDQTSQSDSTYVV